jgi:hypothetical protein
MRDTTNTTEAEKRRFADLRETAGAVWADAQDEEGDEPTPEPAPVSFAQSETDALNDMVANPARHFGSGREKQKANYERFMAGARGEQPKPEQPKTRPEWEKQAVKKLATASDAHLDSLRRVLDAAELSKLGVEDYGDGVEELPTMTDAEYEAEMADDPVYQTYSYDELASEPTSEPEGGEVA